MALPSYVNYQKESENEQLLIAEEENVQTSYFGPKIGVTVLVIGALVLGAFAVINKSITSPSTTMLSTASNTYKSSSKFAPLFMSKSVEEIGLVKTFFNKYGLTIPTPEQATSAPMNAGDPAYWIMATMTTGTDCSGNVISVGGLAGASCVSSSLTSTTKSFMFTCTSGLSGAVFVTLYENDDCSGSATGPYEMTSTNTCTVSSTVSMKYTCATPALSGYDVQTYYLSSDATTCNWDSSLSYDGSVIEASPVGSCIPVPVSATEVDTSDSCIFDKDAGLAPFVTVYSGSITCGSDATSTTVTTLNPVCEDASAVLGMPSWSKWYYRI